MGRVAELWSFAEGMKASEEDILDVHFRWLKAEIEQDMETLGSLLLDDAFCLLPGGERIEGKTKCLEFLGGESPSIERIEISNIWVKTDAELAVKVADFVTRFIDSRLPAVSGTHTWCLKKEFDEWKIQMLTWTMKSEPVA